MDSCLLGEFSTDQKIAEYDTSIQRYMQHLSMTPQQYADDIFARSGKVERVYDESTENVVFIEGADPSMRQCLRNFGRQTSPVNLTDTRFHAESLLTIQRDPAICRLAVNNKPIWKNRITTNLETAANAQTASV